MRTHGALKNKKLTNLIWVYETILAIVDGGGIKYSSYTDYGAIRGRVLRLHRTRQRAFQFERPILARIRFAVTADAV